MTKRWEQNKARIIGLYIKDNKTLEDVRMIMKEHHGFEASIRAYRQHFERWKIGKYNTERHKKRQDEVGLQHWEAVSSQPSFSPGADESRAVRNSVNQVVDFNLEGGYAESLPSNRERSSCTRHSDYSMPMQGSPAATWVNNHGPRGSSGHLQLSQTHSDYSVSPPVSHQGDYGHWASPVNIQLPGRARPRVQSNPDTQAHNNTSCRDSQPRSCARSDGYNRYSYEPASPNYVNAVGHSVIPNNNYNGSVWGHEFDDVNIGGSNRLAMGFCSYRAGAGHQRGNSS